MSEENNKPKENMYPAVDPTLKVVQCVCQGKVFAVLSLPKVSDGSAQIKVLNCVTCGAMVEVNGEGRVGTTDTNIYIDPKGKRHYTLHADPMDFGAKGGVIGR